MEQVIAFINEDSGPRELAVSASNPLPVTGSFTPPVGGATEAEQEAQTALLTLINGKLGTARSTVLTPVVINTASSGDLALVAASGGNKARLYRLILVAGGITNITFKSAATALSGPIPLPANGSITLDFSGDPWFTTATNEAFNLNNSAAVQISGTAYYTLAP
jgi:hypothetical protein